MQKKTEKYLIEEKHLNPANRLVLKVLQELRNIIHMYMNFVYNTDDSLFAHSKNRQV